MDTNELVGAISFIILMGLLTWFWVSIFRTKSEDIWTINSISGDPQWCHDESED